MVCIYRRIPTYTELTGMDPISSDEDVIAVPEMFHPLIDSDVQELNNTILPSAYSTNHGGGGGGARVMAHT